MIKSKILVWSVFACAATAPSVFAVLQDTVPVPEPATVVSGVVIAALACAKVIRSRKK